jgi:hypothetical protein
MKPVKLALLVTAGEAGGAYWRVPAFSLQLRKDFLFLWLPRLTPFPGSLSAHTEIGRAHV